MANPLASKNKQMIQRQREKRLEESMKIINEAKAKAQAKTGNAVMLGELLKAMGKK